jgi:hypothetical protein
MLHCAGERMQQDFIARFSDDVCTISDRVVEESCITRLDIFRGRLSQRLLTREPVKSEPRFRRYGADEQGQDSINKAVKMTWS